MTEPLFPLEFGQPMPKLSADRLRTLRRKQMIEAGTHPLTLLPLIEDHTCKECVHVLRVYGGRRDYYKCSKAKQTHGPGTDLRLKWPACSLFEERK